jgi:hypothetical protein
MKIVQISFSFFKIKIVQISFSFFKIKIFYVIKTLDFIELIHSSP